MPDEPKTPTKKPGDWSVAPGWKGDGPLALDRATATMQVIEEFTEAGFERQRRGTCQQIGRAHD